jgi:hypothetical protein
MGRAWIALLLLGLTACNTKRDSPKLFDREITGEVLLETYTVQMTWGYKLSGMYINADGTVWGYEQNAPWYPDKVKAGELSDRDMLTKHKGANQIGTVDRKLLHDMAQMIKPATQGVTARPTVANTGGGTLEVAYLYDPETLVYREVVLSGSGDRVAGNSSAEAQQLLDYLHHVQQLVGWQPAE